jgi:hypothetical protein
MPPASYTRTLIHAHTHTQHSVGRPPVRSRMSSPMPAISAIPPALSEMGPYLRERERERNRMQRQAGRKLRLGDAGANKAAAATLITDCTH